MSSQPWIKFYPRDWRGDQALRLVSLQARGLWMEMLCVMHEATPYGHLTVNGQPVGDADLARLVGATVAEVQALLVELRAAGVCRQTRGGVIYSKRLIADDKRSKEGRKAKVEALEKLGKNPRPSRVPTRPPTTQKPEARVEVEGPYSPSTLYEGEKIFLGPKEIRDAFCALMGEEWCRSYLDRCGWQDVPERALIPATGTAGRKIIGEGRAVLAKFKLTVLEKSAA